MGEPKATLEDQRLVVRSGLWALAGLLLFVLIMGSIPQPQLTGIPLKLLGLSLALVPALLWLAFFLGQNRKHPQPKRIVLRVLFFSAIAASGAGIRLVDELFKLETWLPQDPWPRLLVLILIVGFSQEFLKYLVVRYTVFTTEDFLDRTDGILYGIVSGLGYATALNMNYVLSNQGVLLSVGSLHMVVTALAQAGFAAVGGYFLAGAKFGKRPTWWVPSGLILAAALNGTFTHLRREIIARGFTYNPWNAFLLALGFTIIVLVILFALTQRAERRNRAEISSGKPPREGQAADRSKPWERSFRYDTPVIGLAILMLIGGWAMKSIIEGERTTYQDSQAGFSIQYPSTWTLAERKGFSFSTRNLRAEGVYKPGMWIEIKVPPSREEIQIQSLVTPLTVDRGRQLFGYRVLNVTEAEIGGVAAMQIEYAYVEMPPGSAAQSALPVVVHSVDTLFLADDKLYIVTYAAADGSFPDYVPIFEGMIETMELGS